MSEVITNAATVLADPDWRYDNFGAKKHGAARGHYPGSVVDAIGAIPVAEFCRRDANLLMWTTLPKLDEGIDVMRAWGFSLVTGVPWVKTVPSSAELAKGIGFWFYAAAEILLVCRRGRAKAPRYGKGEKPDGLLVGPKGECVFYARRGAHSRKPLSLIEWVESYFPGPLLELWATGKRPGWTSYGHQTGWHLDVDGAHDLAVMRVQDRARWLRVHPTMVKVAAMSASDYAEWVRGPEARPFRTEELAAARALGKRAARKKRAARTKKKARHR